MAFVHRRVFYAKVGAADKVVKHVKAGEAAFKKYGVKGKSRILTDWHSGRTDRVVWELQVDSVEALDADIAKAMGSSGGKAEIGKWFAQLTELIHYAEVEVFSVA